VWKRPTELARIRIRGLLLSNWWT